MKLYTQSPHESRMCAIDFRVQRSRSQCIDYCNLFIAFPLHLSSWNITHRLPMSRGCALLSLASKVKVTMDWFILKSVYVASHYHLETSHTDSPWVEDVPYWVRGQRSRLQCINYWNLFIRAPPLVRCPIVITLSVCPSVRLSVSKL